jgi:hypothetical protein
VLDDGDYDVIVVDAEPVADHPGVTSLDLTILGGPAKGEMVSVRAQGLSGDPTDWLGLPGTLTVSAGRPSVQLLG